MTKFSATVTLSHLPCSSQQNTCNFLSVEGESPVMKICLGDDEATHKFEVVPVTPAARSRLKTLQNLDKGYGIKIAHKEIDSLFLGQ